MMVNSNKFLVLDRCQIITPETNTCSKSNVSLATIRKPWEIGSADVSHIPTSSERKKRKNNHNKSPPQKSKNAFYCVHMHQISQFVHIDSFNVPK